MYLTFFEFFRNLFFRINNQISRMDEMKMKQLALATIVLHSSFFILHQKMKKVLLFAFALLSGISMMAQGAHDFKINEVYVLNPADSSASAQYRDEFGEASSWIEIQNISYSTHDIRGCFLTSDRSVLDKNMSAPDRIAKMSLVPAGDARTSVTAKQRITFFADGNVNRGTLHTNFKLVPGEDIFIALYDGNGVDLLDSITIPASLPAGNGYARNEDGSWSVETAEALTPNAPNKQVEHNKIAEWKSKDPYGIAMAILSMGIVFSCLILLFVFFYIFGWVLNRIAKLNRVKAIRKIHESAQKVVVMAKEGTETKGIEMDNYVAAITLALHEYMGNMHDVESGVLTIQHHQTEWESKDHTLRHVPEIHH